MNTKNETAIIEVHELTYDNVYCTHNLNLVVQKHDFDISVNKPVRTLLGIPEDKIPVGATVTVELAYSIALIKTSYGWVKIRTEDGVEPAVTLHPTLVQAIDRFLELWNEE